MPVLALTAGRRAAFVACAGTAATLRLTVPDLRVTTATVHEDTQPAGQVRGLPLLLFRGATALGIDCDVHHVPGRVGGQSGWSVGHAGMLLSGAATIAVASRMAAGYLVDRGGRWRSKLPTP